MGGRIPIASMKQDPTIGDIIQGVRSAPRRLLDVRVSTIWRGIALGIRALLFTFAYVAIVFALSQVLKPWWHVPEFLYVFAVLGPLSYMLEYRKERKTDK